MKNAKLLLMLCSIVVMLAIPFGNTNTAPNVSDIDTGNAKKSPESSYGDIVFQDDFENGIVKWIWLPDIKGLWTLTDVTSKWPDPCNSETHAMWFGQESKGTYDTGHREIGSLLSKPIDISAHDEAYLIFYHWRETEQNPDRDNTSVYIYAESIGDKLIYSDDNENITPWEKITINISSYCGISNIQIKFHFDTIDEEENEFRGWLVDDVMITNNIDNDDDDDNVDDDDDKDEDDNGSGSKKSEDGIGGGVLNFLLSPIGLITIGGITAAGVAVIIGVWFVKKRGKR